MRLEDVESLAKYQCDPRYSEHYATLPDARAIVEAAMSWSREVPRRNYQFAIARSEGVNAIGCIGLRGADQPNGVAEFGCELAPELWGAGLAHEASVAMIAFARQELRLKRVVAWSTLSNDRAQHLVRRLGFVREVIGETAVRYDLSIEK